MSLPGSFLAELEACVPSREKQQFVALAASSDSAHLKSGGPVHFTASGIVIDASGQFVALHHHRKVGAWLQFCGHIEKDEESFETAARREVAEESGLIDFETVGAAPFTLHAHALNRNFAVCSEHWDVQYLMRAAVTPTGPTDALTLSEESHDVRWWRLEDLPRGVVPDLIPTLEKLRT